MEKKYKVIFHIDLNAFFAACEMAEHPHLREEPLAVAGNQHFGIITTANYKAREFGVTSAMPVEEAMRLCPRLVVVDVDKALYTSYSNRFFELVKPYTSAMEIASIDEAYCDMTHHDNPVEVAKTIQKRLLEELQLPCSIGIAPNMFLAKMASDLKKPLGITILRKRDVEQILWPLPIEEMHGLGKKTTPELHLIGIKTIGDFARFKDHQKLSIILNNRVEEWMQKAHGYDTRQIDPSNNDSYQTIGHSKSFTPPLYDEENMIDEIIDLLKRTIKRLSDKSRVGQTWVLTIKTDEKTISRSHSFPNPTRQIDVVFDALQSLFFENYIEGAVRLLGVSVSKISDGDDEYLHPIDLFNIPKEQPKKSGVLTILEKINQHYKHDVIHFGQKKDKD